MDKDRVTLDTIEQPIQYVVTGISTEDRRDGQRMYAAIDSHSGGMPYWSDRMTATSAVTNDIERAMRMYDDATSGYMTRNITDVRIAVIRTTLHLDEIDTSYTDNVRREAALGKLTSDEKRLLGL